MQSNFLRGDWAEGSVTAANIRFVMLKVAESSDSYEEEAGEYDEFDDSDDSTADDIEEGAGSWE